VSSARHVSAPLALALDIGSSSVRAAIHDGRGQAVRGTEVRVPYAWDVAGDAVRLPASALLEHVGSAVDQVVAAAGPLLPGVAAAGVSCFFHSLIGLDDGGRPLTPVISWADATSAREAEELRGRIDPAQAHDISGVPLHASYWPAKILRLRSESAEIRRWAGFPELLAESLTGRAVVSRSMASGTGLLDRATGAWSSILLAALGVDAGDLPAIVADDEPIGRLTGESARRWPALAQVPWFAPWGDGSCGNIGLGATTPDRAALMIGTSGALRRFVPDSTPAIPSGLFGYRLGDGTILGGQLSEGGGILAWASALLGRSRTSLEREAWSREADGHGLTVLPFVYGERSLGYHDRARGTLTGLHPGTDPAGVYQALVESVAFGFAAVDDRLAEALADRPRVIASGGALARSPLLAQVLADALGREIGVAPSVEASRRGAALLALQGIGTIRDLAAVGKPRTRRVPPDPDRAARYRAARARQRAFYDAILG
jgi:gluconokinase